MEAVEKEKYVLSPPDIESQFPGRPSCGLVIVLTIPNWQYTQCSLCSRLIRLLST
jgi:hypothetical protein